MTFLVNEGREDPNTTKVGHHRPASETPFQWRFAGGPMLAISMPFCWRADDSPTINAGLVAL